MPGRSEPERCKFPCWCSDLQNTAHIDQNCSVSLRQTRLPRRRGVSPPLRPCCWLLFVSLIQTLLHATLLLSFLIHTSWLCWLHRVFMGAGKAADVKARLNLCMVHHMYLWNLVVRDCKAGFSATETLVQHSAQQLPFMVIRRASQSAGDNLGHSCFPLTFKQWTFILCRNRNLSSFLSTREKVTCNTGWKKEH